MRGNEIIVDEPNNFLCGERVVENLNEGEEGFRKQSKSLDPVYRMILKGLERDS